MLPSPRLLYAYQKFAIIASYKHEALISLPSQRGPKVEELEKELAASRLMSSFIRITIMITS